MGMSYGKMSESEMLMNLVDMDEWVMPEMDLETYDDLLENEEW